MRIAAPLVIVFVSVLIVAAALASPSDEAVPVAGEEGATVEAPATDGAGSGAAANASASTDALPPGEGSPAPTAANAPTAAADPITLAPPARPEAWDLFGFGAPAPPRVTRVKTVPEPWFPFLPDEADWRSVSIGTVTDGWIVNATALPLPGSTWAVLPRQLERGLLYGSDPMIHALTDAADAVARVYPGSVLWFGNIGRHGGGDIPWSVSHNSGRDADLAFYALDPSGRPVAPPDLLHYDDRGRSHEYGGWYRFDVARNWQLVRALVESRHVQIQHLFISNGLRALLLAHARRIGEPSDVIARAGARMRQPGREIPHNDHLHVRVYCSRSDVGGGCQNTGRWHTGADGFATVRAARVDMARSMARAGEASTRRRAIERLVLLGADALDTAREALGDPAAPVRVAAVQAIAAQGGAAQSAWLIEHWEDEPDGAVREAMVLALGTLGGADAADFLAFVLARHRPVQVVGKTVDLRLVAADAAAELGRAETVAALVETLADDDPVVRARAARALRRITNRSEDIDWRSASADVQARGVDAWRRWWAANDDRTRRRWLDDGFARAGYGLGGGARAAAAELARAAGDPRSWLRINAQLELMRITGNQPRSLEWSRGDAQLYWTRWVRRNPGRISAR